MIERNEKIEFKRWELRDFCDWPFCICISGSLFFKVQKIARRIFKSSAQTDLPRFVTCDLLLAAPTFNAEKKPVVFLLLILKRTDSALF